MGIINEHFEIPGKDFPPQEFRDLKTQQGQINWLAQFLMSVNNVFDNVSGTVTTLEPDASAYVEIEFDDENNSATFDFYVPQGQTGAPGHLETLTATAQTLAAGQSATATVVFDEATQSGAFTFGIPTTNPTDTQVTTAVNSWLTTHPEATTTVQDNSITNAKLVQSGGVLEEVIDIRTDTDGFTYLSAGDAVRGQFEEFETPSSNLWVNVYGSSNGITVSPSGDGGLKIKGTATANTTFRYAFEEALTLSGYRVQYKQTIDDSHKIWLYCRNSSYASVRSVEVNGKYGYSVDSSTQSIKYIDVIILNGSVVDTVIYPSLTDSVNESLIYPRKLVKAYQADTAKFVGAPTIDIDFWGDSLTQGYGGNGVTFPNACATILGANYRNNGHGGENANTIAARQGGNNWIIPAGNVNGTYTLSDMNDVFGGKVTPLRQIAGDLTAKTVYINGYPATLTRTSQTSPSSDDVVYTISDYTGPSLIVATPCYFEGATYEAKIVVIFVGTNGQTVGNTTDVNARIAIIDSMIKHLKHENYVVMGLSNGSDSDRTTDDNALLLHYGSKFFPTRRMLVDYGMTIENLTPTATDLANISAGLIPESLRVDSTHLNGSGYDALGILLGYKMFSLGYDKLL